GPPSGGPVRQTGKVSFMLSFATSPDRIKGMCCVSLLIALSVLRLLRLPGFAPLGTMVDNPIRQRPFKPDVVAGLLRLDPFVLQNLLTLGLELAVKAGVFHQVVGRGVWSLAHSLMVELLSSPECNIGYPVDNRNLRTGRTGAQYPVSCRRLTQGPLAKPARV